VVAADLGKDWPTTLTAAGFQPTQPTARLAEGLLIYLSADQAAHLLTAVGELSAPTSRLAFEHGGLADSRLLAQARAMPAMDQFTKLWKGAPGASAPGWLARRGWQVRIHDRAALAAYRRAAPGSTSGGFVTAVSAATR
jgi:methyltransferase (TIGR00027 family)